MSVTNTREFFRYITYLNQTFTQPDQRIARYNGSYQIILDTFFTEEKFGGDPLVYNLLTKYRDREMARFSRARNAG